MNTFSVLEGDALAVLRTLPDESVHCCVTSPPYWGLRRYGIQQSVWGGDPNCIHRWGAQERGRRGDILPSEESSAGRLGPHEHQEGQNEGGRFCELCGAWRGELGLEPNPDLYVEHMVEVFRRVRRVLRPEGTLWLNLGDCYITNPYGDGHTFDPKYGGRNRDQGYTASANRAGASGLKSKDLVMIPARVALALQADGWYLRSQIPWVKRNGMPDSVPDRPPSMVEYIFLFSKSESYYYDREAVRLPQAEHEHTRRIREQAQGLDTVYAIHRDDESHGQAKPGNNGVAKSVQARQRLALNGTRVRRNADWFFESWQGLLTDDNGDPLAMVVNPQPFTIEMCEACLAIYTGTDYRRLEAELRCTRKGCSDLWRESGRALSRECRSCGSKTLVIHRICQCGSHGWLTHFAAFSERMVEPLILAGSSGGGCCSLCGAPYERILAREKYGDWHPNGGRGHDSAVPNNTAKMATSMVRRAKNGDPVNSIAKQTGAHSQVYVPPQSLGWRPTCEHARYTAASLFHDQPAHPVPCTVLDPFSGSGRTGLVAIRLGRQYLGIEARHEYVLMARWQAERQEQPA